MNFTAVAEWWERHQPSAYSGSSRRMWAELRRAQTPCDALMASGVLDLIHVLELNPAYMLQERNYYEAERVGLLAATLAHVKVNYVPQTNEHPSTARIWAREGLSWDRFQRLLRAPRQERMDGLRQCLSIVKGVAYIPDLTELIWYWEKRRVQWFLSFQQPLTQNGG